MHDALANRYNNFESYKDRKSFYLSRRWRRFRHEVLRRDHYECVECNKHGRLTTDLKLHNNRRGLEVDHIIELEKRPDLAYDMNNLQTLCVNCHNKKHNRFQKSEKKFKDEKW
ncbi:HNH endonuclease [Staphylococcus nepalensis]|uniref:HNH endonuclease n=1 Tax=Staphylococcus TaxID=1279 RepID=UPI001E33C32F|nr:HNH endonuclease signature motif containing protein [Staphylococcus nepalensis]MCD8890993.1 HNH endonuclease [Staphylococcus nepalensis]